MHASWWYSSAWRTWEWHVQGQGNGAFVEGVQKAIATELKVGIADMTNQEKKQLMKQYSKSKQ